MKFFISVILDKKSIFNKQKDRNKISFEIFLRYFLAEVELNS
jgi:hypothetical protein